MLSIVLTTKLFKSSGRLMRSITGLGTSSFHHTNISGTCLNDLTPFTQLCRSRIVDVLNFITHSTLTPSSLDLIPNFVTYFLFQATSARHKIKNTWRCHFLF